MSYEDLQDDSKVLRECTGFTQINNSVINNIRNGDAFLVWCYLYSKTTNWKTIKSNIQNVYGFSDKKVHKIFSYLKRANLITYTQRKRADGKFESVQIKILNGAKFDKTQAYTECAPHTPKKAIAEMGSSPNYELRNKDNTKERKEHNKESYSATDVAPARDDMTFDEFWKIYPIKKNKIRAKRIWEKEKFKLIVTLICSDVLKRTRQEPQWQEKQFIPHPSTYLSNKLWEDEFIEPTTPRKSSGKSSSFDAYQADLKKQQGVIYEHGAIS